MTPSFVDIGQAVVIVFTVAGQILIARKRVTHAVWCWTVANVVGIPTAIAGGMFGFGALYVFLLGCNVYAVHAWRERAPARSELQSYGKEAHESSGGN